MALDVLLGGANVDSAGNLKVSLDKTDALLSGYARPLSEVDAGRSTGTALLISGEVSEDFRARVEHDTLLDSYTFNDGVQNTAKHLTRATTMTLSWAGGFVNTNASSITTINTAVVFQTYQYFPINGGAETYAYFKLKVTGTWAVTNTTIDVGFLGIPAQSQPFAPTDGAFFRINSTGIFGVVSVNGAEQTTAVFINPATALAFAPTIGTVYDMIVTMGENIAVFWIDFRDGNGYTIAGRLATAVGSGRPLLSGSVQFGFRHSIGAVSASGVMAIGISSYMVSQGGFSFNRPYASVAAMMGASGAQGQSGHAALTSTALYGNSLAAGAGTAAANTSAAGTGLGGQISIQPTLAVPTDGIVCNYLNPVASNIITGRQLIVTGIIIQGMITTALTGGPVLYAMSVAWGHTQLSLLTAEATANKAARRKPLGFQKFVVTAPVGDLSEHIYIPIDDIVVNPGENFAIVAKNLGTVTSAGVITFLIGINAHWA